MKRRCAALCSDFGPRAGERCRAYATVGSRFCVEHGGLRPKLSPAPTTGQKLRGRPPRRSLCPVTGLSPPQLALLRAVREQTADGRPTSQPRLAVALGVWPRAVESVMARMPPGLVSWMKLSPRETVGNGSPASVLLMPEGERLLTLADRVKDQTARTLDRAV